MKACFAEKPWALFSFFTAPELDPSANAFVLFAWLLITICVYDTLFSIYDTNYNSLIPDKFRKNNDRLKQSAWAVILGLIGSIVGSILPSLLIDYNNRSSFFAMSIVVEAIALVSLLAQIPGIKETPDMIEWAMALPALFFSFILSASIIDDIFAD